MLILNIQVSSNLVSVIKSHEPEKIRLILENRGEITPSHSAYQRTLLQIFQAPIYRNVEFRIFCQNTGASLFAYLIPETRDKTVLLYFNIKLSSRLIK